MLLEVGLEVGVVLGDEELVVDVAEVVEGLVAGEAVLAVLVVDLLADWAPPGSNHLLLVLHSVVALVVGWFSRLLVEFSWHFRGDFCSGNFKYYELIWSFWPFRLDLILSYSK
jgi:hypothetical protein